MYTYVNNNPNLPVFTWIYFRYLSNRPSISWVIFFYYYCQASNFRWFGWRNYATYCSVSLGKADTLEYIASKSYPAKESLVIDRFLNNLSSSMVTLKLSIRKWFGVRSSGWNENVFYWNEKWLLFWCEVRGSHTHNQGSEGRGVYRYEDGSWWCTPLSLLSFTSFGYCPRIMHFRAVLTNFSSLSQHPPIWGALGGIKFHFIPYLEVTLWIRT